MKEQSGLKAIMSDGRRTKGIDPWDVDNTEAWTSSKIQEDEKRLVPILFACRQLRAKAMADMPFCIYKGDEEVDNSDDYQNVVKFLPDPFLTFWRSESALCDYGMSYWFKERNSAKTLGLYYWSPASVTEIEYDLQGYKPLVFTRHLETGDKLYPVEDVLYTWLPDSAVEVGPPTEWPLRSALICASSLQSVNKFIADYAGRGMIKMFLLAIKGNPPAQEKERIENWWNSFMNKVKQIRWRVFNADAISPTVIGEGLEALKGTQVTDDLKQQILEAMGVPASLIVADAANFATAQQDVKTFYKDTIIPDSRLIQASFNAQAMGDYRLEFEPDRLECFQADESARATALASLAGTFTNSSPEAITLSVSLLGYDLTAEEDAMLKKLTAAKQESRQAMADQIGGENGATTDTDTDEQDEARNRDFGKWQRKALKHIGEDVAFVSDIIPVDAQSVIHAGLSECKTEAEVKDLFALAAAKPAEKPAPIVRAPDPALMAIAEALMQASKAINVTPAQVAPPNANVTINLPEGMVSVTNQIPSQEPPVVNVAAAQAEPVVNVTVQPAEVVQAPAPEVTVKNDVTVQPAEVVIKEGKKKKVKVNRKADGSIDSLEEA